MKILVIAPHMDDEVLGCGGTIARYVKEGHEVHVVIIAHRIYDHHFDSAEYEREKKCTVYAKEILGYQDLTFLNLNDERLDACLQDIIIPLEKLVQDFQPEWVFLCHRGDNNQDHRAVFHAARVVLRQTVTPFIKKILCYEVPSSTEQSPPFPEDAFIPNVYVNIEKTLAKKITAMKCYDTEKRTYPHPRSKEALEITAKKRGIEAAYIVAEAFVLYRERTD
jgi:LmbE family N-acetylglucosaminyl deacetylase